MKAQLVLDFEGLTQEQLDRMMEMVLAITEFHGGTVEGALNTEEVDMEPQKEGP